MRGKKSCHTYWKDWAGWLAPVEALKKAKLITSEAGIEDFFESSCAPGAPKDSKLCKQCVGNIYSKDESAITATKCQANRAEVFSGNRGALK